MIVIVLHIIQEAQLPQR